MCYSDVGIKVFACICCDAYGRLFPATELINACQSLTLVLVIVSQLLIGYFMKVKLFYGYFDINSIFLKSFMFALSHRSVAVGLKTGFKCFSLEHIDKICVIYETGLSQMCYHGLKLEELERLLRA